jgi:uncharacterized membrane protein
VLERIKYIWDELRGSFWFIPVIMIIVFSAAAIFFINLDNRFDLSDQDIYNYIFSAGVESARSMLTIIAGAMIGIAGTVFSITLVALTLASNQLGSRLLRNFMYDRLNQVVLGTYVSTFVYCLIVINTITDQDDTKFVPAISIFVGLLAAIAAIILLIVFIHHIAMSIQSDRVISEISISLSKHLTNLFPLQVGEDEPEKDEDEDKIRAGYRYSEKIKSQKAGYLQSVNGPGLIKLALKHDLLIIFKFRPGKFIIKDVVICEVFYNQKSDTDFTESINKQIITGKSRTSFQDFEFSIHQMVEIASKALSPGVNDPFTAISCIDNLTSVMCHLSRARFPSSYRYDSDGKLRVIASTHNYKGFLDASFNQIRQFGSSSPSVMIRLTESLSVINQFANHPEQKKAIAFHQVKVFEDASARFTNKKDLEDLKTRIFSSGIDVSV